MRGDSRIVAPDLLQQRLARDRPLARAIKVTQDRGLLLGQPYLVALRTEQQLRAWPKSIGADGEDRVLARLMLAQLRPDARQKHGETKRLGDVIIGAGFQAEDRV